eukprot:jgi/Psemu1/3350/gm1.3350_g
MKKSYDPTDHTAEVRRKLQLTRELKVGRKASFHLSVGGSNGYDLWYRQQQMERHQNAKYLYNDGIGLHSNQLISQRLKELQFTNKKPSIKAFKACSPANMRREFLFWNRQLPIGVVGIPRKHFIDTVGNYEKGQKLTVMIAVEPGDPELPADVTGSIAQPHQWVDMRRNWSNMIRHSSPPGIPTKVWTHQICDLSVAESHEGESAAIGPFDATFAHCEYSEDGIYPGVEIPINPNADPPGWGPLGPPGAG